MEVKEAMRGVPVKPRTLKAGCAAHSSCPWRGGYMRLSEFIG